jgi:hypothetical protein
LKADNLMVPEIAGSGRIEKVLDPHELADVDAGVVRAQFGVAESGAVWLTQEHLVVNGLATLVHGAQEARSLNVFFLLRTVSV